MKLKAILDTLDGVDEAVKGFYTERDGKFYLNVEGIDDHSDVVGLKTSLAQVRQEKKDIQKELTKLKERFTGLPDDFSVDDYNASLDGGTGKIDQRLTEQKDRLTAQHNAKIADLTAKLDAATKRADNLYSENALMEAMAAANITMPQAQKAVKAMFKGAVKVEYEGDDVVVTIDNMPVTDKLKAYAQSDEGKFFVTAANNGGGGAGGGNGGGNGTDYSKMTDTQLMLAQDKDPRAKAEMEKRTKIDKPAVQ